MATAKRKKGKGVYIVTRTGGGRTLSKKGAKKAWRRQEG